MFIFSRILLGGQSRSTRSYGFGMIFLLLLILGMGCSGGGSSTGNGGTIKIGWDPNTETDLAGYRIYWGTRSDEAFTTSVDVRMATRDGNLVVYTLMNLNPGQEYCIALTAYNTSNYESGLSNLWGDVCGNAR